MNMLELIISIAIAEAGDYCDVRLPRDVAEQILVALQTNRSNKARKETIIEEDVE